jgi:hypothetical protein
VFTRKHPDDENTALENAIMKLISQMADQDGESDEYTKMADNLKTLMEARKIENETDKTEFEASKLQSDARKAEAEARKLEVEVETRNRPSVDTIVTVAGSLAGILMVLSYERAHVLTSKAMSQVIRLKL